MTDIKINRYQVDQTASVYRGNHWCGMIFNPCGTRTDYLASPWTDAIAQQSFPTEAKAIAYLVREA